MVLRHERAMHDVYTASRMVMAEIFSQNRYEIGIRLHTDQPPLTIDSSGDMTRDHADTASKLDHIKITSEIPPHESSLSALIKAPEQICRDAGIIAPRNAKSKSCVRDTAVENALDNETDPAMAYYAGDEYL
jgi:hypothetical protein